MKEMTPMQRYSPLIHEFRTRMSEFKEIGLNKAQPRSDHSNYELYNKKGVESDFIMIFKAKSVRAMSASFAFAFSFIDLPKEQQSVQVSIKRGESNDSIEAAPPFTLEEFKERLKQFNAATSVALKSEDVFNHISLIFLDKKIDMKQEVAKEQEKLDEFIATKSQELHIPERQALKAQATKEFKDAQKSIDDKVKACPEYQQLVALRQQVSELEKTVKSQVSVWEKEAGLKQLHSKMDDAADDVMIANVLLQEAISHKAITPFIKKKLKY